MNKKEIKIIELIGDNIIRPKIERMSERIDELKAENERLRKQNDLLLNQILKAENNL